MDTDRTTRLCALALVLTLATEALGQAPPPPSAVPGKEYSNHSDEDAGGAVDFLQNVSWDGLGGAVDAFDYSTSGPPPLDPDQVDALANRQDLLFHAVTSDATPFACSFGGIGDVYFHTTTGLTGVWASGPLDINAAAPPDDVDALELWGRPVPGQQHDGTTTDENTYSIIGDYIPPVPPGGIPPISVYCYDPLTDSSTPYIFHSEIQMALGVGFDVDVDALMVFDVKGDCSFDPGDSIVFSLWPTGPFDGGELWVWTKGAPATFLVHGGKVWDTLNPVATIFGVPSENINAFEALPPESVGQQQCFCDAASAPCLNPSDTGLKGCDNSVGSGGALLTATGSTSIAAQGPSPLVLHVVGGRPGKTGIWLQGATRIQSPFKDGLLCVGNPTVRFPGNLCGVSPQTMDAAGAIDTDDVGQGFDLVAALLCKGDDIAAAAPTTRDYQWWYRDGMGPCGTGSNLTNGLKISWQP